MSSSARKGKAKGRDDNKDEDDESVVVEAASDVRARLLCSGEGQAELVDHYAQQLLDTLRARSDHGRDDPNGGGVSECARGRKGRKKERNGPFLHMLPSICLSSFLSIDPVSRFLFFFFVFRLFPYFSVLCF